MTDRWPDDPLSGRLYLSAVDPREALVTTPPATSAPVEAKVKVATIGSYLAGVAGLALVAALSDGSLLAAIPDAYAIFLGPFVPAIVAFASAYLAQHTPRSSGFGDAVDADIKARVQTAVEEAASKVRVLVDESGRQARLEVTDEVQG